MKKNSLIKLSVIILVVLAALAVGAWQALPLLQSPEKALQSRVAGMMTARVDQNWAEIYKYLVPEYKKKVSKESFLGVQRNISFNNFSVETVKIAPSGNEAVVTVKYDMKIMSFDVPDHRETQNWVKSGFKWYYQMKED